MSQSVAPFRIDILAKDDDSSNKAAAYPLKDQFPASFRDRDNLYAPRDSPDFKYIDDELNPRKLHEITRHLWLAGRPVPPRALHQQLLLGRDIIVSERVDIHCVWGQGRIFVKPIPRFLLNSAFWNEYLVCRHSTPSEGVCDRIVPCKHRHLRQCALGFLLSYVALVARESDFAIARTKGLIPDKVTWPKWRRFVRELLHDDRDDDLAPHSLYADVAERFIYGELRLNRLRLIDKVCNGPFSSNFMSNWSSYGSFVRDNVAAIIAATAWILLILSAMQVGLGTERLAGDVTFQAASWGFTVFSMIAPMGAVFFMLIIFSVVFWYNLVRTRRGEGLREEQLKRVWGQKRPSTEGKNKLRRRGQDNGKLLP